jgi:hypothetical protein
MEKFTLLGPDAEYALCINLDLVEKLEKKGGSLFKIADQLVQKELSMSEILQLLCVAYKAAGCETVASDLSDYLLLRSKRAPSSLLSDILVEILSPAAKLGAVKAGEA